MDEEGKDIYHPRHFSLRSSGLSIYFVCLFSRRSDDSSSSSEGDDIIDDVSSEETQQQEVQPMASLLPIEMETSSQPMEREYDDHMIITDEEILSSEEMMSDQPMFTFSDEEADDFNNTSNMDS